MLKKSYSLIAYELTQGPGNRVRELNYLLNLFTASDIHSPSAAHLCSSCGLSYNHSNLYQRGLEMFFS